MLACTSRGESYYLMACPTPALSCPSKRDPALTTTPNDVTADEGAATEETVKPLARTEVCKFKVKIQLGAYFVS